VKVTEIQPVFVVTFVVVHKLISAVLAHVLF